MSEGYKLVIEMFCPFLILRVFIQTPFIFSIVWGCIFREKMFPYHAVGAK